MWSVNRLINVGGLRQEWLAQDYVMLNVLMLNIDGLTYFYFHLRRIFLFLRKFELSPSLIT